MFLKIFNFNKNKNKLKKRTKKRISIAIDGPSGTGKSSVSKMIAEDMGLTLINTGLFYRAIAWWIIQNKINFYNEKEVIAIIPSLKIKFLKDEKMMINNHVLKNELRDSKISKISSIISTYQKVRDKALIIQKETINNFSVVMEGRDTTFRVLPNADVKIYLDAKPEIRTKRRIKQNESIGFETNYNVILKDIKERDARDLNREIDPLQKTDDATYVDSSDLSLKECFFKIKNIILQK